jgi:hypothetical protein
MQEMHSNGLLHITEDQWSSQGFPDFYHSTFHEIWYVFSHWSEFLQLRGYIVRGALDWQDLIVLQKSAGPKSATAAYEEYSKLERTNLRNAPHERDEARMQVMALQ